MQFLTSCAPVAVVAAGLALTLFLLPQLHDRHRPRRARPGGARARVALVAALLVPAALVCGPWLGWVASLEAAGLVWVVSVGFLRWSRRWGPAAHASWSLTVVAGAAYVVAMAAWTASSGLGGLSAVGAWGLWVVGLTAYGLYLSYGYDVHDTLGSRDQDRGLDARPPVVDPASRAVRRQDERDTRVAVWPRAGASLASMGAAGAAAAVLWVIVQPATTTQATRASSGASGAPAATEEPVDRSTLPTFATTGTSRSPAPAATSTPSSRTERGTTPPTTSTRTPTATVPTTAPTTTVPAPTTTRPNGKPIKPKPTGGRPPLPTWTLPLSL
jgi:hypothetical protein